MDGKTLLVNVDKWIAENEKAFLPPVCNKLMHFCQLNIMFVGGPNTRKDYHIEEGEELFYQVRGDMCLKIIENGKHKDVHIREGEMFLLPARIPHSPQREANTVGLVVERRRLLSETDCLRYYVENSTDILFERWFYCENLGIQLVPVIQEFFSSEQYRTGKPNPDEPLRQPPFQLNNMHVMKPFRFSDWVDKHRPELASGRPVDMFGAQFETEVPPESSITELPAGANQSKSDPAVNSKSRPSPPADSEIWPGDRILMRALVGDGADCAVWTGETETSRRDTDIWIWQLGGTSQVTLSGQPYSLSPGDSLLIPGQSEYQWKRSEGCIALFVVQNPERKSSYF